MIQADKTLAKMRRNPRDWRIEDLKSLADRYGILWDHEGTSHVVFRHPDGENLSVPASRPIKAPYLRKFVELVDRVRRTGDGSTKISI